ncbi:hypothetical protein AGMMS50225_28660 [Betaproteobacteria bacterium]|nr:hypothetical protein AGMMS50225_28660 [Betaproteobacteria bacterium]
MLNRLKTFDVGLWLLPLLLLWILLAAQLLGAKTASGENSGVVGVSGGGALLEAAPRLGFGGLGSESASGAPHAVKGGIGVAEQIGILRDAAKGKGNFGLGQATASEADVLGRLRVDPNYRIASDGKTLVSSDGMRTYRPPSPQKSSHATTGVQANFERLEIVGGRRSVISNGHLDITP